MKGLNIKNIGIQANCLKQVTLLNDQGLFDFTCLKNDILPNIANICQIQSDNPKLIPLRVEVILCMSKIFKKFDSYTLENIILKSMWTMLNITKNCPPILMACLGLCENISKQCGPQLIATKVLPHLIPITMNEALNKAQYELYMKVIQEMLNKIDAYRINKYDNKPKVTANDTNENMETILNKEFDGADKKAPVDDDPFNEPSNTISQATTNNTSTTGYFPQSNVNTSLKSDKMNTTTNSASIFKPAVAKPEPNPATMFGQQNAKPISPINSNNNINNNNSNNVNNNVRNNNNNNNNTTYDYNNFSERIYSPPVSTVTNNSSDIFGVNSSTTNNNITQNASDLFGSKQSNNNSDLFSGLNSNNNTVTHKKSNSGNLNTWGNNKSNNTQSNPSDLFGGLNTNNTNNANNKINDNSGFNYANNTNTNNMGSNSDIFGGLNTNHNKSTSFGNISQTGNYGNDMFAPTPSNTSNNTMTTNNNKPIFGAATTTQNDDMFSGLNIDDGTGNKQYQDPFAGIKHNKPPPSNTNNYSNNYSNNNFNNNQSNNTSTSAFAFMNDNNNTNNTNNNDSSSAFAFMNDNSNTQTTQNISNNNNNTNKNDDPFGGLFG